jgi:hypothetical protein
LGLAGLGQVGQGRARQGKETIMRTEPGGVKRTARGTFTEKHRTHDGAFGPKPSKPPCVTPPKKKG